MSQTGTQRVAPRVAVIGARGIGRHHANWWRAEGATVCAVLGRTPESAGAAAEGLRNAFGIEARPYADFASLASAEQPDIYDVCSPPERHAEHVRAALEAGGHVLCEKPLFFDETLPPERLVAEAEALTSLAALRGRRLALCSQYAVVADEILALWRSAGGSLPQTFIGELHSPARGRLPCPPRTWIDLGPHLLAALYAIAPEGHTQPDSAVTFTGGHRAELTFSLQRSAGISMECRLIVSHTVCEPSNVRRLTFDGVSFELAGEISADGHYGAVYRGAGRSVRRPDPLRLLIRDFLAGRDRLDAGAALENQHLLIAFWQRLRQQTG